MKPGSDGSGDPSTGGKGKDQPGKDDKNNPAPAGDGSGSNTAAGTDGETLPKTGEDSHLPLQLAGLSLVVLGALLALFRKNHVKS
ncbi:MAG: LPXTG cell wall anchor domain-containing protein [Paenibacillus sp.]|nr:LPXTG cell wall anchor domain-containing protein [Paenibacillus sp.]